MKVYISEKADKELLAFLEKEGCSICPVTGHADVAEPVACHPDIYYCLLEGRIYEGDPLLLSKEYPGDVLYNAAAVGKYLICSRYTSEDLIARSGLIPVTVPQGYVKCNLAVLDGHHVITEDRGIAKVLAGIPDIECLLIDPGQVSLPGFPRGFIGGATGRVGDMMVFSGDLSAHSCFEAVRDMCLRCGLEPVYFSSFPLTDIGSILAVPD